MACQHPEAWPDNIYGHLREGYIRKRSQIKESAHFNLPFVDMFCVLNVVTVATSNLFQLLSVILLLLVLVLVRFISTNVDTIISVNSLKLSNHINSCINLTKWHLNQPSPISYPPTPSSQCYPGVSKLGYRLLFTVINIRHTQKNVTFQISIF